jgi:hypothetical protein
MTPIYSFLPPYHDHPQQVLDLVPDNMIACIKNRAAYPAWPWAIEELNNSAWRCLHSGVIKLVRLTTERDGKPVLDAKSILGCWTSQDRFVVEHWVRTDHLCLATQLMWFGVEIAYWHSEIEQWMHSPDAWQHADAPFTNHAKSPRTRREALRQAHLEVERALKRARAFATCHGLSLGPEILNAGIECASAKMQMALL